VCDIDLDNDGTLNDDDSCPLLADTVVKSGTLFDPNHGITVGDLDRDGIADVCDPDKDGDRVLDVDDRCSLFDDSVDTDDDGVPDECDPDRDGDGIDQNCDPDFNRCGCIGDLLPDDPTAGGDHDFDGIDTMNDICPCDITNRNCEAPDLIDPADLTGGSIIQQLSDPFSTGTSIP
jgi:hypothetical protein